MDKRKIATPPGMLSRAHSGTIGFRPIDLALHSNHEANIDNTIASLDNILQQRRAAELERKGELLVRFPDAPSHDEMLQQLGKWTEEMRGIGTRVRDVASRTLGIPGPSDIPGNSKLRGVLDAASIILNNLAVSHEEKTDDADLRARALDLAYVKDLEERCGDMETSLSRANTEANRLTKLGLAEESEIEQKAIMAKNKTIKEKDTKIRQLQASAEGLSAELHEIRRQNQSEREQAENRRRCLNDEMTVKDIEIGRRKSLLAEKDGLISERDKMIDQLRDQSGQNTGPDEELQGHINPQYHDDFDHMKWENEREQANTQIMKLQSELKQKEEMLQMCFEMFQRQFGALPPRETAPQQAAPRQSTQSQGAPQESAS